MDYRVFLNDLKIFISILFQLLQGRKVAFYMVRGRFGQAATGISLALNEINKIKPHPKVIIINYSDNLFFKLYLKEYGAIFFSKGKFPYYVYLILNKLGFNCIKGYSNNYFENEVNLSGKLYINEKIIGKILPEDSPAYNILKDFTSKRFICISIKEKGFYSENKEYTQYVHPEFEFDSINRIDLIINFFTERGYNVVRVGRNLNPAQINVPGFLDYGSSEIQSDLIDAYLAKNCEFVISNQTGFDMLAAYWFNKPIYMYQIRAYRFLLENYPFRMFNPIKAERSSKRMRFDDVIKAETELWTTIDQNDLSKSLERADIKYLRFEPEEVLESVKTFLNDFECCHNDNETDIQSERLPIVEEFWNVFNHFIGPVYEKAGRKMGHYYITPNVKYL